MPPSDSKYPSPARIISRREKILSPWTTLIQKTVEFSPGENPEIYDTLLTDDYITMLAFTPNGEIPLVRQYRPAVEQYTWELPSGLIDPGETPEQACVRELKEETGLNSIRVVPLGMHYNDIGRLGSRQHAFYIETDLPETDFIPEPGMWRIFVDYAALIEMIWEGHFPHIHISVLFLYELWQTR